MLLKAGAGAMVNTKMIVDGLLDGTEPAVHELQFGRCWTQ